MAKTTKTRATRGVSKRSKKVNGRGKAALGGAREGAGHPTMFKGKYAHGKLTARKATVLLRPSDEIALSAARDRLTDTEGRRVSESDTITWCIRKATGTPMQEGACHMADLPIEQPGPDSAAGMPRPLIYSFGYSKQSFDIFVARVLALDAQVIDTRLVPYSRKPDWNKSRLLQALGEGRYVWVEALGNVNYKEGSGPIQIKDLNAGLAMVEQRLADLGRPPVLICICADQPDCHRNVALMALAAKGYEIQPFPIKAGPADGRSTVAATTPPGDTRPAHVTPPAAVGSQPPHAPAGPTVAEKVAEISKKSFSEIVASQTEVAAGDAAITEPVASATELAADAAPVELFRVIRVDAEGTFKANVIRPTSLEAATAYVAASKSTKLRVAAVS